MRESSSDPARIDRFTVLYDTYYHRILGYSRRRTNAEDALDIVAETFTIAWRRLEHVPEGEQALWWLYATARRVLANHRRAERRQSNLLGALEAEPVASSSSAAELEPRLATALAKLREDERELLLLVAWEGLDAKAIAAIVRCSRNAARIRVHRVRRRLAAALAAVDDELEIDGALKRATPVGQVVPVGRTTATLRLEDRP